MAKSATDIIIIPKSSEIGQMDHIVFSGNDTCQRLAHVKVLIPFGDCLDVCAIIQEIPELFDELQCNRMNSTDCSTVHLSSSTEIPFFKYLNSCLFTEFSSSQFRECCQNHLRRHDYRFAILVLL